MENPSKSIVLRWKQKHYFVIWNFGWHIKQTISEPVVIFKSLYRGKSLNTEVKLAANRLHPFGSLAVWRPGGSDKWASIVTALNFGGIRLGGGKKAPTGSLVIVTVRPHLSHLAASIRPLLLMAWQDVNTTRPALMVTGKTTELPEKQYAFLTKSGVPSYGFCTSFLWEQSIDATCILKLLRGKFN